MNSPCKHTGWLNFTSAEEPILWDTGRLSRILLELANPTNQRPSLLLFVGRKAKDNALRELFPCNNFQRAKRDGIATLTADTLSLQSQFPILFAESDPWAGSVSQHAVTAQCHENTPFPIRWTLHAPQNLSDLIHARLLCLFVDVLCIFADDFCDFEDVVSRLRAWAACGRPSSQFNMARPRVIIIRQGVGPGPSPTYDFLQSEHLHYNLSPAEVGDFFSSITVLHLANERISSLARHRRLKELIQRQTDEMRHVKQTIGCLFSAVHLNCFFTAAAHHTAQTIIEPFDFLATSRQQNPVSTAYSEHLNEFLRLSRQRGLSHHTQSMFIASAMLLNAYPPGMHCESVDTTERVFPLTVLGFDPEHIFAGLYESKCLDALSTLHEQRSTARRQGRLIKDKLVDHFVTMQVSSKTAAAIHQINIANMGCIWMQFRSNDTCLCCIQASPENHFTCGHSICDVCVRIFGRPVLEAEYVYMLDKCVFCSYGTLQVALKPPTAGARILSVDGGGIRGVVPLEFLASLQETIGPDCPIQDLFDLAFGTSSGMRSIAPSLPLLTHALGGLIVLGLFLRQWTVAQCSTTFDTLTRGYFAAYREIGGGIRRIIRCWLSDGYYDATALEATLKQQFGEHQRMFGPLSSVATKVAVTTTTISNALPVLLSNYNGTRSRQSDCGWYPLGS